MRQAALVFVLGLGVIVRAASDNGLADAARARAFAAVSSASFLRFLAASAVSLSASFCQRSSHSATFPPQARTNATATGSVGRRSPPAAAASVFISKWEVSAISG